MFNFFHLNIFLNQFIKLIAESCQLKAYK